MANSNSPASKKARLEAVKKWRSQKIKDGSGKQKNFYLVDDQIETVEKALKHINPQSQTQALVDLCDQYNKNKKN